MSLISTMQRRFRRVLPLIILFPGFISGRSAVCADSQGRLALIDLLIQDYSSRLGIKQEVTFSLVAGNPFLVSVQRVGPETELFQLMFEEDFLTTLDDRDLCAAIAHELGHVWIFTHFPYLQTEALANEYALKLVSQEDLDSVFAKVRLWKGHRSHGRESVESAGAR